MNPLFFECVLSVLAILCIKAGGEMGSCWVNEMVLFYLLCEKNTCPGRFGQGECTCVGVDVCKCMNIEADMGLMCRQDLGEATSV